MKIKSKIVLIIAGIMILYIFGNTFINSRKEYKMELNFKISKIDVAGTNSLELYNMKGEKITLWNYILGGNEGIMVGDSISKGVCSEKLYVFKRDSNNLYKFYLSRTPSGMFPRSWFCN